MKNEQNQICRGAIHEKDKINKSATTQNHNSENVIAHSARPLMRIMSTEFLNKIYVRTHTTPSNMFFEEGSQHFRVFSVRRDIFGTTIRISK